MKRACIRTGGAAAHVPEARNHAPRKVLHDQPTAVRQQTGRSQATFKRPPSTDLPRPMRKLPKSPSGGTSLARSSSDELKHLPIFQNLRRTDASPCHFCLFAPGISSGFLQAYHEISPRVIENAAGGAAPPHDSGSSSSSQPLNVQAPTIPQ